MVMLIIHITLTLYNLTSGAGYLYHITGPSIVCLGNKRQPMVWAKCLLIVHAPTLSRNSQVPLETLPEQE